MNNINEPDEIDLELRDLYRRVGRKMTMTPIEAEARLSKYKSKGTLPSAAVARRMALALKRPIRANTGWNHSDWVLPMDEHEEENERAIDVVMMWLRTALRETRECDAVRAGKALARRRNASAGFMSHDDELKELPELIKWIKALLLAAR